MFICILWPCGFVDDNNIHSMAVWFSSIIIYILWLCGFVDDNNMHSMTCGFVEIIIYILWPCGLRPVCSLQSYGLIKTWTIIIYILKLI